LSTPLNYRPNADAMIIGVGLMGQHMATHVVDWLGLRKLVLVDYSPTIAIGTEKASLVDFATSISAASASDVNVVAETVDVTDENDVRQLFERHPKINYLQHTAGISPKPLTPPEDLTKEDVMGACEVNVWGAHNVLKQGVRHGGFAKDARGVIILSTSATVGAEGRASAAYEESKGGLINLLKLQSRHFVETHRVILNGLAPSPLRGPMAAQNEMSAGRLQAVEDAMPLGGLTAPKHISAATMFFWSDDCWCVGEVLTTDGGYTKHKPIYGPLHAS
jgi:NAD(P)-dependent dehydrogenase (short-subunit alcohol dehydrogenase family)